jgi:rubrerythrin
MFGPDGALELIKHEMAHLSAFEKLLSEEGIAEEVCFELGDTFDAAMSDEAWTRLKGAYEEMRRDHGVDGDVVRECRLIEDSTAAEEFTYVCPKRDRFKVLFIYSALKC